MPQLQQQEINWKGVGYGLALLIFAAYQQLKIPPVLPILIEDYAFGRVLAGGFMSVFAVVGLLLSVRLGQVMQRRGVIAFLNAAFILFAAASALMMLWPEIGLLFLVARTMEGVGFAILAIAGPAICTANAGVRGLAIAAALIATWIPLGSLIANLLAAALVEPAGWRALWLAGLLATGAMAWWTSAIRRDPGVRFGTASEPAATEIEQTITAAEQDRRNTMILSAFLFALWSVQLFAYMTWVPDYLVSAQGFSPQTAALIFVLPMAVLTLFNLVAAPILRIGVSVPMLFILSVGVQTAFWFALPALSPMGAGIGGLVIYAAAAGITPTCLFALPGTIYGVENAGSRSYGVLMTGRNLGVLSGPLLAGTLIHMTGGWDVVPPVLGAAGLAAIAGAVLLHFRLQRTAAA